MTDSSMAALSAWERWIAELEVHPLDGFEFEAMLSARDEHAEALEIAGRQDLWTVADALDERFRDVTVDATVSSLSDPAGRAWWWRRLPPSELLYEDESLTLEITDDGAGAISTPPSRQETT